MEKIKIYKETTKKELEEITKKIFKFIALNGGGGLYVHAYLNTHHKNKHKINCYYYRCLYLQDKKNFHSIYEDYYLRTIINKDIFYRTLERTLLCLSDVEEVTIIY